MLNTRDFLWVDSISSSVTNVSAAFSWTDTSGTAITDTVGATTSTLHARVVSGKSAHNIAGGDVTLTLSGKTTDNPAVHNIASCVAYVPSSTSSSSRNVNCELPQAALDKLIAGTNYTVDAVYANSPIFSGSSASSTPFQLGKVAPATASETFPSGVTNESGQSATGVDAPAHLQFAITAPAGTSTGFGGVLPPAGTGLAGTAVVTLTPVANSAFGGTDALNPTPSLSTTQSTYNVPVASDGSVDVTLQRLPAGQYTVTWTYVPTTGGGNTLTSGDFYSAVTTPANLAGTLEVTAKEGKNSDIDVQINIAVSVQVNLDLTDACLMTLETNPVDHLCEGVGGIATVKGSGFAPNEPVAFSIFSTERALQIDGGGYTALTDGTGAFETNIVLPDDLEAFTAPNHHTLRVVGQTSHLEGYGKVFVLPLGVTVVDQWDCPAGQIWEDFVCKDGYPTVGPGGGTGGGGTPPGGTCSNPIYTTQTDCEGGGGTWTEPGTCSNPVYTNQANCVGGGGVWTPGTGGGSGGGTGTGPFPTGDGKGYCSVAGALNQADCVAKGGVYVDGDTARANGGYCSLTAYTNRADCIAHGGVWTSVASTGEATGVM